MDSDIINRTTSSRSEWQIWMPFVLVIALTAWSPIGLLVMMVWTGIGVIVLKLVRGGSVPHYGLTKYRTGFRKIVLVTYHIVWWPAWLLGNR